MIIQFFIKNTCIKQAYINLNSKKKFERVNYFWVPAVNMLKLSQKDVYYGFFF